MKLKQYVPAFPYLIKQNSNGYFVNLGFIFSLVHLPLGKFEVTMAPAFFIE